MVFVLNAFLSLKSHKACWEMSDVIVVRVRQTASHLEKSGKRIKCGTAEELQGKTAPPAGSNVPL